MKHQWNPWIIENWSIPESEWNGALPMISLGVLNYNRRAELRQTLDVLTNAVQYPNYEIIVVDNGSTDKSLDMIRSEYPLVRICEVGTNAGVSARNFMTPMARGKYLFHFDDDTCPGTPAMVLRIVQHMEEYSEIDALSTSYYRPVTGLMETKGWELFRVSENKSGFYGGYIVEGGICFRVSSYRALSGYDPAWSLGQEGMELGIQFVQARRNASFCPWFVTLHFISSSARARGKSYRSHRAYANSRQTLWMIAKHWPSVLSIPLIVCVIIRRCIAMAMHPKTFRDNLIGLRDGFKRMNTFRSHSPKLTIKQSFLLWRWYYSLFRWA